MTHPAPRLAIIVIVYRMRRQAMNTLYSLSLQHQRNVRAEDYEVIVVENESPEMLDESAVLALGSNMRYFRRAENSQSPAPAINFGLAQTQAAGIGLMIDGARMVTPRIIEYALLCQRADPHAMSCAPGYFLGPCEHQYSDEHAYDEAGEIAQLERIRWRENGYRLFDISTLSAANTMGFFQPFIECNCFFTSRENLADIGGAHEGFDLPGGGALNLYIYRKVGLLPRSRLFFVMPGEGSFHQLHGGVTTTPREDRKLLLEAISRQLNTLWGDKSFQALHREPILVGAVTSHAQKFMRYSSERSRIRFHRLQEKMKPFWPDDRPFPRQTEMHA